MIRMLTGAVLALSVVSHTPIHAQSAQERRVAVNGPVVGVMGAGLNGQMTKMLGDIASVTKADDLRVLQMIGEGSLNNINDLLYLKGVDAAMIQSDALNFYDSLNLESNISSKIAYIAPLGRQEAHILARRDSAETIDELEGKRVNFGKISSGTVISASQIFAALDINVDVSNMGHKKALKALAAGEIDAMFWMTPQPAELLARIEPDANFHFLSIPASRVDTNLYPPSVLEADHYPFAQSDVETVSTMTVLAAYNWPSDSPRRPKVQRLADSLRANFEELRGSDFHGSFRAVNLNEPIPGTWTPF